MGRMWVRGRCTRTGGHIRLIPMKLRFSVVVTIDTYPRAMSEKAALEQWERIAKRIERAAKGRSKIRTVSVA